MKRGYLILVIIGLLFITSCAHYQAADTFDATEEKVERDVVVVESEPVVIKKEVLKEIKEEVVEIDSDHDGLFDSQELILGLDPTKSDTDGDGLYDREEVDYYKTDPLNEDTDGDSWLDGCERTSKTDPLDNTVFPIDEDNDGLDDLWEIKAFGLGRRNTAGLAYGPNEDRDRSNTGGKGGDKLSNLMEYCYGTSPVSSDTDKDGLEDGEEIFSYYTNPLNEDTDSDGFKDGKEVYVDGTDPLDENSHMVLTYTRNQARSVNRRSAYRPTGTYLGQSVNTDNQQLN
ncbi:hypothetical protein J4459_03590 [Candidatus Woesearchaeota archaeon]|nr:hypothetical protein [Candidatus Woesearchaeota archaeon]